MNAAKYYQSITQELNAVKDRVANLIDEKPHQGEIGSWREALVRSMLRRHLPATMGVGQGFVLTDAGPTTQLDVIVYDLKYPRLLQEGDLVIVTPDAVRAIVEVKTATKGSQLREDLRKLATVAYQCRMNGDARVHQQRDSSGLFVGYFAFEKRSEMGTQVLRQALRESVLHHPTPLTVEDPGPSEEQQDTINELQRQRQDIISQPELGVINALAIGPDRFVRYWGRNEPPRNASNPNRWKQYELSGLAFGYFLVNLIASVSPHSVNINHQRWWPDAGKGEGTPIDFPNSADFDLHRRVYHQVPPQNRQARSTTGRQA